MNNEKTGLLYNIRRNRVLKKLASKQDINIYSNLDSTLKKDKEIRLLALQCVKDKKDFNLFPEDFLHENISNCSDDIQRNFTSWTAYGTGIKYLSQSMQYKLVEENNEYFSLISSEDRKKLVLMDNKLFKKLSTTEKISLIKDKAELISLCDLITIEENIKDISVETAFLYAKEKNLELDKYYQLMQLKYDYNNPKEYMLTFSKYASDKTDNELLEFLKRGGLGNIQYADISFQERAYKLRNDISLEILLYGDMSNYTRSINFSIPFIETKFKELYGAGKWSEYSSLFNDKNFINTSDVLFSIINGKNSIVLKNDPKQVVDFFKLMVKSDKSDYDNAALYNDFYDLVANTYGKEALYFLKERPGLNYSDISNIEIFNPNVLNNFRKGFIDDLLSYNFGGYTNELVEICNNPEELKSFKLLYDRFSTKLGENVETMLLTFSRYDEYKEILKEAITTGIKDDSTLEKIDALCMWPKNILNVKHVSELDNLEENLSSFMEKYTKWSPEVNDVFDFKNPYDYQVFNRFAMDELYNIKGYVAENNDNLKKDSILLSNLLNEIGNQYVHGLISMYSFLIEYKNQDGNLTNCFENLYKLLNDAREYSMKYFRNHVVTDKEYIDNKIATHSDDADSMSIYGLEVYDLGKMKVNFASHSYDMNNSVSKEDFLRMQKEYLTYDSKSSISTISAYPVVGEKTDFSNNRYIFWNFKDNLVMSLFTSSEKSSNDGVVSWQPKRIVSGGYSNCSLNEFRNIPEKSIGGEIAFYRRKRNHDAIEREKYGGKIIPDAVSGYISPEILDAASGRFGKNVPIILPRGSLSSEERKNNVRRQIVETYLEMNKENKIRGKNYHVPSNLNEIVSQELLWVNQNQSKDLVSYYNSLQSYINEKSSQPNKIENQDKVIRETTIK